MPSSINWTIENDDAYIKLDPTMNLMRVYNMGVKVCDYWAGKIGSGGVIVTKSHLSLNISRNMVLEDSCPIWKRVSAHIRLVAKSEAEKRPERLTDARRVALLSSWVSSSQRYGDDSYQLQKLSLLPTMAGYTSILHLTKKAWTIAPTQNCSIGERLHKGKACLVLSPEVMGWVNASSPEEFATAISSHGLAAKQFIEFESISAGLSDNKVTIEHKMLSKSERALLSALGKVSEMVFRRMRRINGHESLLPVVQRTINAGSSSTAEAWTDGRSKIWINENSLKRGLASSVGFEKLIKIIIHEYCHPEPAMTSHSHGFEFYELFHEAIMLIDIEDALRDGLMQFCKYMRAANIKPPVWIQRAVSKGTKYGEIPEYLLDEETVE